MSLKVDLRVGETIEFNGGLIRIRLLEKSGQRARISVEADDSVKIKTPPRPTVAASSGITADVKKKMLAGAV